MHFRNLPSEMVRCPPQSLDCVSTFSLEVLAPWLTTWHCTKLHSLLWDNVYSPNRCVSVFTMAILMYSTSSFSSLGEVLVRVPRESTFQRISLLDTTMRSVVDKWLSRNTFKLVRVAMSV